MAEKEKETATVCPASRQEWRLWLQKNHGIKQSAWLVYYKKHSGKPSISWSEAVDEALCFGWIDSTKKTIDDESFMQFFCRRKPNSTWSKINKAKTVLLISEGLMEKAGYQSIDTAKQNGSWTILDGAEDLTIPKDLEKEFKTRPGSKAFFLSLSNSVRKAMLQWLVLAKQEVTRQKRIKEIAGLAAKQLKPKQF